MMFLDFNSIKVRLKLSVLCPITEHGLVFQFHKGTIKTNRTRRPSARPALFQFHKGTIKTLINFTALCQVLKNFNSIKVRLKRETGKTSCASKEISIP